MEAAGGAIQLLDGQVGLPQGFGGLLRRFAQLGERVADLLGAGGLGVHAFIDRLEPRGERLHLMNDLRQLRAHLPDLLHAAPRFLGEFIHAHHAGGDGRLHFLDHFFNVIGRHGGLVGQPADFHGHDGKAQSVFAGLLGFNRRLFGGKSTPVYDGVGSGRRSVGWMPGNLGAVAALAYAQDDLRARSRDLVRRNAWAAAGVEAFVANAIGTGIKPQSMIADVALREAIHALWWDWCEEADAAGLTDFYGLQALGVRAMLEGGEAFLRIRYRRPEDGLVVPMQLQVLEPEHVPVTYNAVADNGNAIRCGIEFDGLGRRVAYWMYRSHPFDALLTPMSAAGGNLVPVRVPAEEVIHLFRVLRPGQIRGEPWLARALVKLNELDQYDDAELVRKKTAAMFAGFITRLSPEDTLLGEGAADAGGVALAGLEPGTMQILEPGEDIKFSQPADVGSSYSEFMRQQFRAVAAAMGITYEMLTGDLTQVNYSSIRAGLLEFRRRCEAIQHSVIVHQFCRPVWRAWMEQAVLAPSRANSTAVSTADSSSCRTSARISAISRSPP